MTLVGDAPAGALLTAVDVVDHRLLVLQHLARGFGPVGPQRPRRGVAAGVLAEDQRVQQ